MKTSSPKNTVQIEPAAEGRYIAALQHLGFPLELFLGEEGKRIVPELRRDGSQANSLFEKENYLADTFILADQKQLALAGEETPFSEEQQKEKTTTSDSPDLREESLRNLFTKPFWRVTKQILQAEPLLGKIIFENEQGTVANEISVYLEYLRAQEFPALSGSSENKKVPPLNLPTRFYPRLVLETPSGLVSKIDSVSSRKSLLLHNPSRYLFNTEFLQQLQQDLLSLESIVGPLPHLPLPLFNERFKGQSNEQSDGEKKAPEKYALEFKIAEERVYIINSASRTVIISVFSSPEKEKEYGPFEQWEGMFALSFPVLSPAGSYSKVIEILLESGQVTLRQEYGVKQMEQLENQALRRKGFEMLESGSSDVTQAKRLITLTLGRMEKYTLLGRLAEEGQLQGLDTQAWELMAEVTQGRKSLASLPAEHCIYFVQPSSPMPAINHLLSSLKSATGIPGELSEMEFQKKFYAADSVTQKTMIAQYLGSREEPNFPKSVKACQELVGEAQAPLVQEIAAILSEETRRD